MSLIRYEEALKLLKEGEVVAVPTETVYGLAGRIDSEKAIKKIFQIKRRPFSDPLIVHFYDKEQLKNYIHEDIYFLDDLWDSFSPGPLTLVLKKTDRISSLITASKESVATRIPQHPLIRKLLKDLQVPLAIPSANLFSQLSPTRASHVLSGFSEQISVLDGGECKIGLESTLIKIDQEESKIIILRPGSITKKDIENFLSRKKISFTCHFQEKSSFPGGLETHYAPPVPLIIVESEKASEQVKLFLLKKFPNKKIKLFLFKDSSEETAFDLYKQLRDLSQEKTSIICVQKTKNQSSLDWKAVWNRLEKASSYYFNL